VHIVCPSCHATNRVPAGKPADSGKCGQCHRPLFDGHPVELDEQSFARHINNSGIAVLVDFWAPWCGPCRMMAPVYEQAAARLQPHVRLAKVNTEKYQELAANFGIRSIPTVALFSGGREIARTAGAMDLGQLTGWVRQHVQGL